MKNLLFAMAMTIAAVQCSTAWSETAVFQLGATIPASATLGNRPNQTVDPTVQTQQLIRRGNKTLSVTSIVVP